ncbi:MAG: caspase family protein, partial [Boseongicola sp.]|nr:caspase family protein [Boseongicola sp.]
MDDNDPFQMIVFCWFYSAAFSPDGQMVAISAENGMGLWSASSDRFVHVLPDDSHGVRESADFVAFSPDGRHVLTGLKDGIARLWDARDGGAVRDLHGHAANVLAVAFSPDGETVATGAEDGTVRLWDADSGHATVELAGHEAAIRALAFSPDGRTVATGSDDGTVRLWDADSGRRLLSLGGQSSKIHTVASGGEGGRLIAFGLEDGTARLWDARAGLQLRLLERHSGPVRSVALNPDGRFVLTGSEDGTGLLWDVQTGQKVHEMAVHEDAVRAVAFSRDGRVMATGSQDMTVRLWDAGTGSELRKIAVSDSPLAGRDVESIAFSPNGRTIVYASTSYGGNARIPGALWELVDVDSGAATHDGYAGACRSGGVAFSRDGRMIAHASECGTVLLADVESGRELKELGAYGGPSVRDVAFAPEGRTIALGLDDGSTQIWDVEGGRELLALEGHGGADGEIVFSLDGRIIARGSADGTVRLRDARTGAEVAQFVSFADGSWVALTPEGFFNASEGAARNLHLSNGLETLSLDQFHDALYRPDLVREALAGDPDGKVAAAAARLDLGKAVDSGLPPEVVGLRSLDGESVAGDVATMSVDIEPRDGGIGRVEWRVNGIVQGADSRGLGGLAVSDYGILRRERQVLLSPGENVVSVTVYNEANLIASTPLETTVHSSWRSVSPPSLHVLAAGVNDYWDGRLQLNYAVSDARAIGAALRKAGRGLYEDVKVTYLLDEEVTRDGLSAAFDRLAGEIRPQDAFVLFLAGHGTTHD